MSEPATVAEDATPDPAPTPVPAPPPEPAPADDAVAKPAPEPMPEPQPAEPLDPEVETAPTPQPAPSVETAPVPLPAPAVEPAPTPQPAPSSGPAPASQPEPEAEPVGKTDQLPLIVVEPEPGATGDAVIDVTPEEEMTPGEQAAATVVTGRLPRIGDVPVEAVEAPAPEPALSRNAIAFSTSGDQPLLAFVLIDTGADRTTLGDLDKLPFPVTVAVDASAADAADAMAFYRAQGAEVALIVPLPSGATPTDVDVTIEAYAPLLAGAVAVLAEDDLGFQTLGDGAVQLATNLAESGHGLVSFPSGLNTGHKAALKAGVRAGLVFRDLDSKGQDAPVIRRFLDNAAFRARSEDGVIVIARTEPETLQALLEWSLGTRAQSVALAPLSAVLLGD